MLSVIIPAFNEEAMIELTSQEVSKILNENSIPFELLFINDGSSDTTWEKIEQAAKNDPHVRGVCFSRNFGKEAAIFAGLKTCKGDCAVVMDCDLQHPPNKIPEMYRLWEEGYEIVEGVKKERGRETLFHKISSLIFYGIISKCVGVDMENASDFKLIDRKVIDQLNALPEKGAFFRALSSWVGYKKTTVEYLVQERVHGVSKWSTRSLIRYALNNITAFTNVPLLVVLYIGVILGVFTVVNCIVELVRDGVFWSVRTSMCCHDSIMMIALGIIGYYLSKIYSEVQKRPNFIISRMTGDPDENK